MIKSALSAVQHHQPAEGGRQGAPERERPLARRCELVSRPRARADRIAREPAAIKAGDEDASVVQFPSRIRSLGIATTWKVVTKQKVAKNVDTGTALVTKANAGQFG